MKKVFLLTSIILAVIIINNFVQSVYNLWRKQDLLTQAQNQLNAEQKEHEQLKKQLSVVKSQQFIEEQARDKLFFVKPGEKSVVIPQNLLLPTKEPVKKTMVKTKANWQLWVELFFR